jgi:hypothetical protein
MISLRALTSNVVQEEDGELSCTCGAALGRTIDVGTYPDGHASVLNETFQLDTSTLIRYRLGVDADQWYGGKGEDVDGNPAVEQSDRRESGSWWETTVRETLMDLKRRVRALESNFNHHDRELTDHFNKLTAFDALLGNNTWVVIHTACKTPHASTCQPI